MTTIESPIIIRIPNHKCPESNESSILTMTSESSATDKTTLQSNPGTAPMKTKNAGSRNNYNNNEDYFRRTTSHLGSRCIEHAFKSIFTRKRGCLVPSPDRNQTTFQQTKEVLRRQNRSRWNRMLKPFVMTSPYYIEIYPNGAALSLPQYKLTIGQEKSIFGPYKQASN